MEKLCEFCSLTRYCLQPGENADEWSFIVTPVLLGVIKQRRRREWIAETALDVASFP